MMTTLGTDEAAIQADVDYRFEERLALSGCTNPAAGVPPSVIDMATQESYDWVRKVSG